MVGLARFLWMAGMCLNFVGPDALIGPLGGSFHRKSFAAPAASSFLHVPIYNASATVNKKSDSKRKSQ